MGQVESDHLWSSPIHVFNMSNHSEEFTMAFVEELRTCTKSMKSPNLAWFKTDSNSMLYYWNPDRLNFFIVHMLKVDAHGKCLLYSKNQTQLRSILKIDLHFGPSWAQALIREHAKYNVILINVQRFIFCNFIKSLRQKSTSHEQLLHWTGGRKPLRTEAATLLELPPGFQHSQRLGLFGLLSPAWSTMQRGNTHCELVVVAGSWLAVAAAAAAQPRSSDYTHDEVPISQEVKFKM